MDDALSSTNLNKLAILLPIGLAIGPSMDGQNMRKKIGMGVGGTYTISTLTFQVKRLNTGRKKKITIFTQ
jgi:hypothetical protein